MAGKFYAVTRIKHGKRTENDTAEGKYEQTVFEPGDEVTGLSKEDMKSLWNAGALEQREADKQESEDKDKEQEETPQDSSTPSSTPPPAPKATTPKASASSKAQQQ